MAKIEIKLPEEFLLKVSKLETHTDEIVERTLEAGGKVVLSKVKGNLSAVVGSRLESAPRSTGELESALGLSPADVDNSGIHNVKVGFNEPRRKQYAAKGKRSYYEITNAMIANVIEYGKHGQPPKPFLKPAKSSSRAACQNAMKAKLEEEIEKL